MSKGERSAPKGYAHPADAALGSSTRGSGVLLAYLPEQATAEQRANALQSALWQRGDMRLCWVNEGDLATLVIARKAVSFGRKA